jgi:hypothetical protein
MLAIIALNVIFAAIVIGGVVGLLGRSVWISRTEVAVHPARAQATRQVTRRRLVSVTG